MNELIKEKSPYLLQHSYNPVNWFAWGEEAFKKAVSEDKPVFLSIGYSTCHWCHVMARESFEDKEVASVLNEYFVSIKVDREERPDIDNIYMSFCQAMTGSGGWPLTIIMTPDKKPFFAGTYFPKHSIGRRIGLIELLEKVREEWKNNKTKLINSSEEILSFVEKNVTFNEEDNIREDTLIDVVEFLKENFDSLYGGFGSAPKFPTPHNLSFLLRYHKLKKDNHSLEMVEKTLVSMYKGGMFDHIGYGFSRYSTDQKWLVPHFEKMLYDNALLLVAYTEAYLVTKDDLYKEVSEKIIEFIKRDMTSSEGAFYSAIDADFEGEEGKYYTFDYKEIEDVLGERDGKKFSKYYGISAAGNFEGKNIPNLIFTDLCEIREDFKLRQFLSDSVKKLYKYRSTRKFPHIDDKVLTSWNGLMIGALALASRAFNNSEYLRRAKEATDFILTNLVEKDGRLLGRYRDGESKYKAYLEDYAYLIYALIELYEATFDSYYLTEALRLNRDMLDLFWDDVEGGLFLYGKDSEQLIIKTKDIYDGAMPSGNSVASMNLIRLSMLTEDKSLMDKSEEILKTFGGKVITSPISHTYMLMTKLYNESANQKIVIVGEGSKETTKCFLKQINNRFLPFTTVMLKDCRGLGNINSTLKDYNKIDDKVTAYVCKNQMCLTPITDLDRFKEEII